MPCGSVTPVTAATSGVCSIEESWRWFKLAAEELPVQPPRELVYCRFPLVDGTGNSPSLISLAVDAVANLVRRQVPTLITCGGGMSRSPAIAAAALSVINCQPPEEALLQIAQRRRSDVTPGLWLEIKQALAG